jgi:hypothetical protein
MTENIPKNGLFATPAKAANCIYKAMRNKKDVAYVPGFWFFIMFIVTHIPEFIFKRQTKIA